jgi:ABC-2 type transport system ATP-binding protein
MSDAITISGVTKTFGSNVAVRDLDLTVPEGALYGFIGPNGAGKTTTLRMVMSILFPDNGEISVLGRKSAIESKDRIGYLPEERGVYRKMKVGAFLAYMARIKGVDGAGLKQKIDDWLERVELPGVARKKCEELSKGMQQKVQVVATLIHEPDLLILDEPFSGLDPVNMRLLRDLILDQHAAGRTVIFSTHVMHQAETICDHIVMINNGVKVLDDTMTDIRARFDPRTILFESAEPDPDLKRLQAVTGVESISRAEGAFEAHLAGGANPTDMLRQISAALALSRIELRKPTLEDVFIEIVTSRSGKSEEAVRQALHADAKHVVDADEIVLETGP